MTGQSNKRAGLTLLELLVSLALLALIAAGLSGSMQLGVRIWDRSVALDAQEDNLLLRAHLRNWVSLMAVPDSASKATTGLRGQADSMAFQSRSYFPHQPDAMAVNIALEATKTTLSMGLDYLDAQGRTIGSDRRVLSEVPVTMFYFDGRTQTWVSAWDNLQVNPILIRIEALEETIAWPPFIAATRPG